MILPLTTRSRWPASPPPDLAGAEELSMPSRFLYVWTGDRNARHADFLAVVDVGDDSSTYGAVIATVPVGTSDLVPYQPRTGGAPAGHPVPDAGREHEQILLFDFAEPSQPYVVSTMAPPLRQGLRGARLAHRHGTGPDGFLRSALSMDAANGSAGTAVHPRGLAVLTEIDRLITIGATRANGSAGAVVQLWRLSDLTLLRTLDVPSPQLADGTVMTRLAHVLPFVSAVLPDGSVQVHASGCGVYRLTGVDGDEPRLDAEYTVDTRRMTADVLDTCGVPVVIGDHWIVPSARLHALVVLDVRDPDRPVEVAWLSTGSTFRPHWLAHDPGSHRVVIGAEDGGVNRMLMARFESATGRLTWDESFRAPDGTLGISFQGLGSTAAEPGTAYARAALFRP